MSFLRFPNFLPLSAPIIESFLWEKDHFIISTWQFADTHIPVSKSFPSMTEVYSYLNLYLHFSQDQVVHFTLLDVIHFFVKYDKAFDRFFFVNEVPVWQSKSYFTGKRYQPSAFKSFTSLFPETWLYTLSVSLGEYFVRLTRVTLACKRRTNIKYHLKLSYCG